MSEHTDTITDPYFVNAFAGKEMEDGGLLVQSEKDGEWEKWKPCGQVLGEAEDRLYKSKWYRRES